MENSSGSSEWGYDPRGRLATETVEITGVGTYTTGRTYNSADLLVGLTYPNGETLSTSYNAQGAVTAVDSEYWISYAGQAKYDEAGRLLEWTLGNGVKTSNTYNIWSTQGGRLSQSTSSTNLTPSTTWQHLAYSYDANGNLSTIQDYVATETLTYSYDVLDRLTGVSGAYSQGYGYDATTGNLDEKAGLTLGYGDAEHPHAATSLEGGNAYSYDANGNMVSREIDTGTYTLSYDAGGQLVGISGGGMSASYTYNGDGKRVKAEITTGSDTQATAYIGDYFEVSVGDPVQQQTLTPPNCSTSLCIYLPLVMSSAPEIPDGYAWTSYYYAGGSRVAMRVQSNQDGVEEGVYYFLSDHLGSTAITLDAGAGKVAELRYSAWGETRYTDGTTPTQRRYTGQIKAETGLYFYQARWFDPALGRFAQADSIIPEQTQGTQAWDRYAYANNSPVQYNDMSGHCIGFLLPFCIAASIWIADHAAIIGAVAVVGAITSFTASDSVDLELAKDPVASQQAFENSLIVAGIWLGVGDMALAFGGFSGIPKSTATLDDQIQDNTPVLKIDSSTMPNVADNVKRAQSNGAPRILTRTTDPARIESNRKIACANYCGNGSPDEYPFASTYEGGVGAFVQGVPLKEQLRQGGVISAFYRRFNILDGDTFRVEVK